MSHSTNINGAIDHLKSEYAKLQIGTANTALVEDLEVESYGSKMPLKATANIACPDPKTIKIEPWDKSLVGEIEKTVQAAKLGLNPQNMGEYILIPIPPMTEDRRKDLVKKVGELAENAKISIRNSRHEEMKHIKHRKDENEISEDQQKDLESDLQELVDTANKDVEEIRKKKETDVMSI